MFIRSVYKTIEKRIREKQSFIQVLAGPRQTGKTTLAHQLMEKIITAAHYASSDEPALKDRSWIEQQWEIRRLRAKQEKSILVLDEIQKIPGWSETVKRLWDEDSNRADLPLQIILLGSSPLLMQ